MEPPKPQGGLSSILRVFYDLKQLPVDAGHQWLVLCGDLLYGKDTHLE